MENVLYAKNEKVFFIIGVYFLLFFLHILKQNYCLALEEESFVLIKLKRILLIRHKCAHIIRSLFE